MTKGMNWGRQTKRNKMSRQGVRVPHPFADDNKPLHQAPRRKRHELLEEFEEFRNRWRQSAEHRGRKPSLAKLKFMGEKV